MARHPTLDPALAATIRRLREERGISREGLAFRSMISTGSLARIELGKSVPGWDTVRLLAKALDVPLVELVATIEASRDCITPCSTRGGESLSRQTLSPRADRRRWDATPPRGSVASANDLNLAHGGAGGEDEPV